MGGKEFKGDYLDGKFTISKVPDGDWVRCSPSDLSDEVFRMTYKYDHVDQACLAAKKAFTSWANMGFEKRKAYLMRLKDVFLAHQEDFTQLIARETGKPLWEAKTEAAALVAKIDITVNESIHLVDNKDVPNALPGVHGKINFKPRGVLAVIGPFNFPVHLPNGHIIPALATGNTVVFKPSEWTPGLGQLMAEMYHEAQFPPGVFNLVQGTGEVGQRLVMHEAVDGILFTGSYEVGFKIKQNTLGQFWKILALEMGGKNASVVWDDCDLNKSIYENLTGAFLTAGQRCSCTSRIVLNRKIYDQFISKFYESAKKLKIGHWAENPFMGPLINEASVDKYIRFQGIATREGAESLMRGKVLETEKRGYYVTPSIHLVKQVDPDSVYQTNEIFGPNVAIYAVDDFEEATQIVNNTNFGLVASLFSSDKGLFERAQKEFRVGLLNWNRSTVGASSRLPFGGLGKSGNHQPSGHFAVYYCTSSQAILEDQSPLDVAKQFPGMNFSL